MSDLELASSTKLTNITISTFFNSKNRTSFGWKYFGNLVIIDENNKKKVINHDQVYCLACLDKVKQECDVNDTYGMYKSKIKSYNKTCSTSNMTRHLREEHNLIEENIPEKPQKEAAPKREIKYNIRERPAKIAKKEICLDTTKITEFYLKDLNKNLVIWICRSLIPFDSISDDGMMDFFKEYKILAFRNELPSRGTLATESLDDVYENLLNQVKEKICADAPQHVAMTLDFWTDRNRDLNFVSFTLHYLTNDFELKRLTLSTNQLIKKNSKEEKENLIHKIRVDFGLTNIKVHLVSDAGVNFESPDMEHQTCFGQGFHNLLTEDGLKNIPELTVLIQKCQKILKIITQNTPALEKESKLSNQYLESTDDVFELLEADARDEISIYDNSIKIKVEAGAEQPQPVKLTPSRWHVLLKLLEWATQAKTRDTINNMLKKVNRENMTISQQEWTLLKTLTKFLKSFEETIHIITSQTSCNLNVALLFRSEVIDVLNSVKEDNPIFQLSQNMLANINKRLPVSKAVVAAALLDSRFANLKEVDAYLESNNMDRTTFLSSYIKDILNINGIIRDDDNTTGDDSSLLHKLSLKHQGVTKVSQDDPIEQECWRYMASAKPFQKHGHLLNFWDKDKNNFPWVSSLAKALLCVPVTSTASEKIFTNFGLECTTKILRLNRRLLNKIIFVHDNYKAMNVTEGVSNVI